MIHNFLLHLFFCCYRCLSYEDPCLVFKHEICLNIKTVWSKDLRYQKDCSPTCTHNIPRPSETYSLTIPNLSTSRIVHILKI